MSFLRNDGTSFATKFEEMICEKMIQNCHMSDEVTNAYQLCGPDLTGLRGKTVWREPLRIQPEYVQRLPEITEQNELVILMTDIMFMNKILFIIIYGWGVELITVE